MAISRKPGGNEVRASQAYKDKAKYIWGENDQFIILGSELNIIMKSLQVAADNPEFRRQAAIYQGLTAINGLFKEAVEEGLIKEEEPESQLNKAPKPDPSPNGNKKPETVFP